MTFCTRCLFLAVLAGCALAGAARPGVAEADEVVRRDWYFRESLQAIADWEDLLAAWEDATPEDQRTPLLPVPADGGWTEWPNPIPLVFWPEPPARVRVRWAQGRFEIERRDAAGRVERQTASPGETLPGVAHPGGGGKDHWYHAYHRRFDQLLRFQPVVAPIALAVHTPGSWQRGGGTLRLELRGVGGVPCAVSLALVRRTPREATELAQRTIEVDPNGTVTVPLEVELDDLGGSMLQARFRIVPAADAEGNGPPVAGWLPLLAHIERADAVLTGVSQILADTPDARGETKRAALQQEADVWLAAAPASRRPWSALYADACALRDRLLRARIDFDTLLFVRRKPFDSEQPFMDAHHLVNRPGGDICRLTPVRPDGECTTVIGGLGEGVYRDLALHWQADRFLFAFGNGSDQWDGSPSYHIYEARLDGSALRQLTEGPKNDCEPFYLPNGQIGFTSDRSEHFAMCGGDRHSPTLFAMDADGGGVRQLSFNVFNDFNPCVLPDGRILYSRWEYNERSVTSLHNPFTMNADGTMVSPYYGNATIRPNVVMFPRPVPGSRQIMALFTAHHGQTHGAIGLIDVRRGLDGDRPLTVLTPGVPITGERAEDSRRGWFSDPQPLSETTYLCSYTPTVVPWHETTWGLYVGDRHGNLALVYRDPGISCAEPVPVVARQRPHELPAAPADCGRRGGEAELVLVDTYAGLPEVPRGAARYLRILEDVPRKSVPEGGVIVTAGSLIFSVKRVLGTVPVEPDGSAHFIVPANRNVYFEVLDERYQEIQRMRSVVCLKPGERRTCIGCHESRHSAPPDRRIAALYRAADRPQPPPWGTQIVSYLRDVQPVLQERCVACHAYDRGKSRVILTGDLTDQFCVAYEELLPYLNLAVADRWDQPQDVEPRPAYTYGSKSSPLMRMLSEGHQGVELTGDEWQRLATWVDTNAVYYDRYENADYGPKRNLFTGEVRDRLNGVYARRCAGCHGNTDGRHDTWWLSIDPRDPLRSRALMAPLVQQAGGWQRCGEAVFADTDDADYRALHDALAELGERLARQPRPDWASVRGTPAETQAVALPPPPPPTVAAAPADAQLPPGDWVSLGDLPWESASAGWTATGDRVPRIDRDAADQPLRLAGQRYARGIGTHAPSEIVYVLEGAYERFHAVVGGAEGGGTVVFQVYGDDALLADSGPLRGLGGTRSFDLDVAGMRRLRLVVTDAGDNYFCDMANWAAARLLRAAK